MGLYSFNILVCHIHLSIYLSVPKNKIALQNRTDGKSISIHVLKFSSNGSKYSSETEKKKVIEIWFNFEPLLILRLCKFD